MGNPTTFTRDGLGRELSRNEATGTPEERTTTTTRDTLTGKPLSISRQGQLATYTYDTDGRLKATTVSAQP